MELMLAEMELFAHVHSLSLSFFKPTVFNTDTCEESILQEPHINLLAQGVHQDKYHVLTLKQAPDIPG